MNICIMYKGRGNNVNLLQPNKEANTNYKWIMERNIKGRAARGDVTNGLETSLFFTCMQFQRSLTHTIFSLWPTIQNERFVRVFYAKSIIRS